MSKPSKNKIFKLRLFFLLVIFLIISLSLITRLAYLTIVQKKFLENQGDLRTVRTIEIPAYRGIIFDRNGEPLAVSTLVKTIWGNPKIIKEYVNNNNFEYTKLEKVLKLDKNFLKNKILNSKYTNKEFIYIKRHIAPDIAVEVEQLNLPGVYSKTEFKRYYPSGEVTANFIGLTSIDDEGLEGVESYFDNILKGKPGKKQILQDRLGRVIKTIKQTSVAKPGENIYLSLDLRLQYLTYTNLASVIKKHQADAGIAILMDTESGEILSLVNQPSFNPNDKKDLNYKEVRNRAFTDLFEPGSLMKPISMAAALSSNNFLDDIIINTSPGKFKLNHHYISDVRDYGKLNLAGIIKKSSNVGISKLTLLSEPNNLLNFLYKLGFTYSVTNLPGEATGWINEILPGQHHKLATLSFGYGIAATPLQIIQAYSVLANHGQYTPMRILKKDIDYKNYNRYLYSENNIISSDVTNKVLTMLNGVMQPDGTGRLAQMKNYETAGKSGTTRRVTKNGYDKDSHNAMFIGLAPYPNPKFAMLVFVINPKQYGYYGGMVAGPVFKNTMLSALKIYGIPPNKIA